MNFDTTQYKIWTWKHPLMLHWIINPGLAINELILGQRIPRITLLEKNNKKTLTERSFIPCPHCNTIHSGLKWTPQNKTAFGNWFGLYCDNCNGIIPCLRNVTSGIILLATFPVWIWFYKSWKRKWLEIQKEKFSKPLKLTIPEHNWVRTGLSWGFFMFMIMELIYPLIMNESYSTLKIGIGVVIWTLAGLIFGYSTKKIMMKKSEGDSRDKTQQAT